MKHDSNKFEQAPKRPGHIQKRSSWTPYRFFKFFFSADGLRRVLRVIGRRLIGLWRTILGSKHTETQLYKLWMSKNMPTDLDFKKYYSAISELKFKPLISVLIDITQSELSGVNQTFDSLSQQIYQNFELIVSAEQAVIEEFKQQFPDMVLSISEQGSDRATRLNNSISNSKGEFICFINSNDLLTKDALFQLISPGSSERMDLIYSDEDKVDNNGNYSEPFFKPSYSPDLLLSRNYFGHLVLIRKDLLLKVGALNAELDSNLEHDLWLRAVEQTKSISRIPKVLCHVSASPEHLEEARKDFMESGMKAIDLAIKRRGHEGHVEALDDTIGTYRVDYKLQDKKAKVSIIIPTKDRADLLSVCLNSIFDLTQYSNLEVIIVNNNSEDKSLFELLDLWKVREPDRFKVLDQSYPFNFAKLMNAAVDFSTGDYLLFLNNDTEVIQSNWIHQMLANAQRKETGAVGVKLLFPNDKIQHAGVVVGMFGIASHSFAMMDRDEKGYQSYLTVSSNFSAVTAACMMVSREKFIEVNGFEEALAVDLNDIDFCLKLVSKGYYNVCLQHVELYHYESISRGHPHATRESYNRQQRELKYFKENWPDFISDDPFYSPNLSLSNRNYTPRL